MRFIFFLLCSSFVWAVDYDCIVVGTSPFSLFEALYQANIGNRVLILEATGECGGSWKGIDVCGVQNVDLGCHLLGQDLKMKDFLEEYAGCRMVCMDQPEVLYTTANQCPNGFYFSRGCHELIDHLVQLIQTTNAVLLLNHPLEEVSPDPSYTFATVKTKDQFYTASKIIVSQGSSFQIAPDSTSPGRSPSKSKYYHLYLLIDDPSPPLFTYQAAVGCKGVSRVMNLTSFLDLAHTGHQLLVIQTSSEEGLRRGDAYLEWLKEKKLIDQSASILRQESNIYERGSYMQSAIRRLETQSQALFEVLNTSSIHLLTSYIAKWKTALKPYDEVL